MQATQGELARRHSRLLQVVLRCLERPWVQQHQWLEILVLFSPSALLVDAAPLSHSKAQTESRPARQGGTSHYPLVRRSYAPLPPLDQLLLAGEAPAVSLVDIHACIDSYVSRICTFSEITLHTRERQKQSFGCSVQEDRDATCRALESHSNIPAASSWKLSRH